MYGWPCVAACLPPAACSHTVRRPCRPCRVVIVLNCTVVQADCGKIGNPAMYQDPGQAGNGAVPGQAAASAGATLPGSFPGASGSGWERGGVLELCGVVHVVGVRATWLRV